MTETIKNQFFPLNSELQVANSKYKFSFNLTFYLLWFFLCVYVINYLGIEKNKGFDRAAIIIAGGFVFYIFLPLVFRKLALVILTLLIEIYLLGVLPAIGVFFLILSFVALTYISNLTLRNLIILIIAITCGVILLMGFAHSLLKIIIMFAAIFLMLRYIFLLYELKYFKTKPVFIDRFFYLFMLPGTCFPLFPVVDPKIFFSQFYSQPSVKSLERGLKWITRGILHTIIYRIIYLYLIPSPYEIDGFWKLIVFVFTGYSLMLRMSGLFYISLGFLSIFGFSLPEIFDNYFFATSFSDLWRRINLYWRDFITRVFYYPLLFKLKKWPMKKAVLITTLFMFFCTWFLHSWQWFWIKGNYAFNPNDVLFWTFLAIVISIDSVLFLYAFDKTKIKKSGSLYYAKQGAGLIFILVSMSLLWTFWTSGSITEWIYLITFIKLASTNDILIFCIILILLIFLFAIIKYLYDTKKMFGFVFKEFSLYSGIIFNCVVIILFFIFQRSEYKSSFLSFVNNNLNNKDRLEMERGYYEQILNNDENSIELFNFQNSNKKWNLDNLAYVTVNNILIKEFKPNFKTVFKGDSLITNKFGLRDKEYKLKKDSTCTRIALLGGSYEMGSGVSNDENFESITENAINNISKCKVEILNFGEGGYHLLQNVYVTLNKIKIINPDYLFYFAHSNEIDRNLDNFINVIEKKRSLSFAYLDSIYSLASIKSGMCRLEKFNRIKPFRKKIVSWAFATIYDYANKNNIIPVFVYLPANASLRNDLDKEFCFKEAKSLGFEILDLTGVYNSYAPESIQLSLWDAHPNKKGHLIIAGKLLEEIKNKKEKFKFLK